MAILTTPEHQDGLVRLFHQFREYGKNGGTEMTQVSTESLNVLLGEKELNASVESNLNAIRQSVSKALEKGLADSDTSLEGMALGLSGRKPTKAQLDALTIISAATVSTESMKQYHKKAVNPAVTAKENVPVVMPSSNTMLGYNTDALDVSQEAFDNTNIETLRAFNLLFAFNAAVQDEAGELFFRTVTLSPDTAGLTVTVRRTMIMSEQRHALTGQPKDWKRRNLLDAITDPAILTNNTTDIYPRVIVGNPQSEKHFADAAKIAPKEILANGGTKIMSAPLRPGLDINLIGIGANDSIPGTMNQTDSLASAISVTKLYYEITTADGTSVIAMSTKGIDRSNFLKSAQGLDRGVTLDFQYNDILLTGATTDITGAPAAALTFLTTAPYENTQLRMKAHVTGHGNLQLGNIQVNSGPANLAEARDYDPVTGTFEEVTNETTLDELRDKITKVELVGYEVKASRSNLNRRQLGHLIDSLEESVSYVVPLGSPISVQTPITDTPTATDLAGPLNAQRLTNSINAVTKILEVRDTLRNVRAQINYDSPTSTVPEIEGFARLMVRPVLVDDTLNVADVITNTSSASRTRDVMAVITNKIRYAVTKAYTDSRYQPALDAINGTSGEKPTVAIITDPVTASYLAVEGDWRTVIGFDVKVAVSYDIRFRGKIAISFVRPQVKDVDYMSFGCMAYVPELMTNAVINYDGGTQNVQQVQNRTLHVCLLPILIWLEIEGLDTAATEAVDFNVRI